MDQKYSFQLSTFNSSGKVLLLLLPQQFGVYVSHAVPSSFMSLLTRLLFFWQGVGQGRHKQQQNCLPTAQVPRACCLLLFSLLCLGHFVSLSLAGRAADLLLKHVYGVDDRKQRVLHSCMKVKFKSSLPPVPLLKARTAGGPGTSISYSKSDPSKKEKKRNEVSTLLKTHLLPLWTFFFNYTLERGLSTLMQGSLCLHHKSWVKPTSYFMKSSSVLHSCSKAKPTYTNEKDRTKAKEN